MDLDSVVAHADPAARDRRSRKEVKGKILGQSELTAREIDTIGIRDEKLGMIEGQLVLEVEEEVAQGNGLRGAPGRVV
jgi:hypothetical protein